MKFKKRITRIIAFVLCVVVCLTASPMWMQQLEAASLVQGISEQSEIATVPETEIAETRKRETEQIAVSKDQTDTEKKQTNTEEKQSETEKQSDTEKQEESEKQSNAQDTERLEEKEEEKSSEKESEKPKSEKVTPKLAASEFTVDAVVAAGIEDRNFAQAIYDSIVADPTKFLDGNTLEVNNFSSTKELLEAFTGKVDADGTHKDEAGKIKSIEGVSNLKSIVNLNLKNNLITDLNPLAIKNGASQDEIERHYGLKGINLSLSIIGNPIRKFPTVIGGRINITDPEMPSISNYDIPLTSIDLVYISNGEKDFSGSYIVPINIYMGNQAAFFKENSTIILEPSADFPGTIGSGAQIPENAQKGGQITELPVENIKFTGSFEVILASNEEMNWYVASSRDTISKNGYTLKFYIPIETKLYTNTKLDNLVTDHSVSLKKLGADDNQGKAGAVYNLYKKNGTGTDELAMENLTTDANGLLQVKQGLSAAEYYFKEIKAPEGYEINPDKVPFVVEDGRIIIKGGAGNELDTADGNKETINDGVFMLSGDTKDPVKLEVQAPDNGELGSITIEWTEGNQGGTAGKQTFTVTNTENAGAVIANAESKINDARQLYQNVKVSASFTQSLSVQQLDTLTPINFNLKADKKVVTPNGSDVVVPEGKFKFHLVNDKTSAATPKVEEVKANDLNGTAEFNVISIGAEGTYHYIITEIDDKDPDYIYDTNEYKVEVVIGKAAGRDKLEVKSITYFPKEGTNNTEAAKFTNTQLTVPFRFHKVDGDDHTIPLKDVKFTLYKCVKNHKDDSQHDVLVTNAGDNCWKEKETAISDQDGLVRFTDIPSGDYQLVEIQTNVAYNLPLGQWRIHVDVTNREEPIKIKAVGDALPPAFIKEDTGGDVSYKLPNFKKSVLPLTGGTGTILFTVIGIILIGGAIILFIMVKQKQKRKGEKTMIKKKFLKRVTTLMLASVMAIGMLSTNAFAAGTTQAALPDPGKDGKSSVTIHKYIMDDIASAGEAADGTEDAAGNIPEGATPLNGVTFKINKLAKADDPVTSITFDPTFDEQRGKTATDGTYKFDNLPFGTYKIEETTSVVGVSPAEPFLVSVPMTNPKGDGWIYDVHVYPKNEKLAIDKFVVNIPNKDHTATVGKDHEWIISSTVPTNMVVGDPDTGIASKIYKISDELDTQLTYVGNVKVCAATKGNAEITDGTLVLNTDYTLKEPTQAKGGTLEVELMEAGIRKVARLGAKKVHVHFTTKLNETAKLGVAIPNGATLDYTNAHLQPTSPVKVPDGFDPADPNKPYDPSKDARPEVHTGGVQIKKTDDKGTALAGAEFKIYASEADAKAGTNPISVINSAGNGFTEKVTSDATGLVKFHGLAYGGIKGEDFDTTTKTSYWIVETKAPTGYRLLDTPVEVIVSATSHLDDAIAKTIVNNENIILPVTGGMGTVIFTISGLALILLAVFMGFKARKKIQQ